MMNSTSDGDMEIMSSPSPLTERNPSPIPNVLQIFTMDSVSASVHSNTSLWYQNENETFQNSSNGDLHLEEAYNWSILMMCPLVVFGVGGNLLVIMAISLEKRLQNVTNYFLLSLAVTDFLVSLIVMPFSIINELTGKWLFGLVLCDLFCTADVLMCTSSILHLCTISLERYIGIRYPLWTKNKSKSVVLMKIVLVWTISIAITSPITVLGLLKPHNVLQGNICALNNAHFIIYGSIFAFFIPLVIMLIMYGLTVRMLNKQAKLCSQGAKDGAPMMRRSTSTRHWKSNHPKTTLPKHENVKYSQSFPVTGSKSNNGRNSYHPLQKKRSTVPIPKQESPKQKHERHSFTYEKSVSSEHESPNCNSNSNHIIPKRETNLRDLVKKHQVALKAANRLLQKRDSVRKDNSVKTEQKATKVLGVVFVIFIICWAPFFIANIMTVLCKTCSLDYTMITAFVWLGYVSSTLNPIIYTIFNRVFKMTFVKLLKCSYNTLLRGKRHGNVNARNVLLNCNSFCASANSASIDESIC